MPELTKAEFDIILRNDFTTFIEGAFGELNPQLDFIRGKYIELIASRLEDVRNGKIRRLIINLPPRTLKSHAASVAFPAWLLGQNPSMQILCASYGQYLADKHARDCRTLMASRFYRRLFPRTVLSQEKRAVEDFMTTKQGFRLSASIGGPITGRGADIILIDDPLKPEDALSEAQRTKTNDWYFNTLLSRLNSKSNGAIVIVMQRLHQDDLAGAVQVREPWDVLSLPAIATEDEDLPYTRFLSWRAFRRKTGEVLHPQRDSLDTYRQLRGTIDEYNFQSQYQQSPVPREGGFIKRSWIRSYTAEAKPKKFRLIVQSWDTANKAERIHDYSVCTTWGIDKKSFYLLHVHRQRLDFPTLKSVARELYSQFKPNKVVIEDRASGTALIQEFKASGMYGVEAYEPKPGSDKQMRVAGHAIKFESGQVLLPDEALWLQDYVTEITGFPGTKFDDQVDSTSQALDFMSSKACLYCELDGVVFGRPSLSSQLGGYGGTSFGRGMSSWSYLS